jgi:hypothetical protein
MHAPSCLPACLTAGACKLVPQVPALEAHRVGRPRTRCHERFRREPCQSVFDDAEVDSKLRQRSIIHAAEPAPSQCVSRQDWRSKVLRG